MLRLRAAVVLLLVAAAWAPLGQAGTREAPELTDAAGDHVRTGGLSGLPDELPGVPGLSDDDFADVDVVAAWFSQREPCTSPAQACGVSLTVATSAGWTDGTLTASFRLARGPTSFATSTASGQAVNLTVSGTQVTGVPNATASVDTEGLTIRLDGLGAVGGDQLVGLNLTTTRTDAGLVTDPSATQDDVTATDAAGPGTAFTFLRSTPLDRWGIRVLSVDGAAGAKATVPDRREVVVAYEVTNLGTDLATYVVEVRSDELPTYRGEGGVGELAPFASARHELRVPLADAKPGDVQVRLAIGGTTLATATIAFAPPAAEREVKPAGLDFLTPAAESSGLDKAFGSYAELALLAVIVLLAILAVFLLVALAPSTLAGASAPTAPPLADAAEAAPAGVLAGAAAAAPVEPVNPPVASGAGTTGGALAIESVTHEPEAPEEGQAVGTEVVLRNPGPTRQVKVVLSLDGADIDDKTLLLPARATKTVRLAWTAGAGENRVKVRVLPA